MISNGIEGKRRHIDRWSAPSKALVKNPRYGSVVVPCETKFAALLCAAEAWGVSEVEAFHGSEVWAFDEKHEKAARK